LEVGVTGTLRLLLLFRWRNARSGRQKAPYQARQARKRQEPLRKERLVWSYGSWTDGEFRRNYRMGKDKFKELQDC
jgi:hypothetical protein